MHRHHPCRRLLVGLVLCLGAAGGAVRGGVLNIVQTGITGAQSQLDVAHSYQWNFTVGSPLTFEAVMGSFTLKKGPSTVQDAVMTLWSTDSSFVPVTNIGSAALTSGSATQSFVLYVFPVVTGSIQLQGQYALTLTSTAADTANQQWFIKGQTSSVQFLDGNDQTIGGITYDGGVAPVPEPSSIAMAAGGMATTMVIVRRRRRPRLRRRPA